MWAFPDSSLCFHQNQAGPSHTQTRACRTGAGLTVANECMQSYQGTRSSYQGTSNSRGETPRERSAAEVYVYTGTNNFLDPRCFNTQARTKEHRCNGRKHGTLHFDTNACVCVPTAKKPTAKKGGQQKRFGVGARLQTCSSASCAETKNAFSTNTKRHGLKHEQRLEEVPCGGVADKGCPIPILTRGAGLQASRDNVGASKLCVVD